MRKKRASPETVQLTTRVNGEIRQDSTTDLMVHSIEKIVEYASAAFTLLPGDVILTGTPAGVGKLNEGDTVEVEIDGIGKLPNLVK